MSFPGPFPVSQTTPSSSQDLTLRLNDRITAHVMEVTPTQAVLDFKGYPVVARLTSKDQASELLSRKSADFVISQVSPDQITLKIITNKETAEVSPIQVEMGDWAEKISTSLGLEGTNEEIKLIQSALFSRLPITKELVSQILDTIKQSGIDVENGIDLAIQLKAAGLPVTASSLQLASQFSEINIGDSFQDLLKNLQEIFHRQDNSPKIEDHLQTAIKALLNMTPDINSGDEKISESLQKLFQFLTKPYEKILSDQLEGNASSKNSFTLLNLVQLEKDLRQAGDSRVADSIGRFLDQVRQIQFQNIKPEEALGKGQWNEICFFVQNNGEKSSQPSNAKIRISYRQDKRPPRIDPDFTNLMLQVDLEPGKEVALNLSLYQKKVNAEILASDEKIKEIFDESVSEFNQLLEQMGYSVVATRVHMKQEEFEPQSAPISENILSDSSLDIEV